MSETNNFPICRKCGQALQSNARFCVYCGTEYVQSNTLQADPAPSSILVRNRRADRYIKQNHYADHDFQENNEIVSAPLIDYPSMPNQPIKRSAKELQSNERKKTLHKCSIHKRTNKFVIGVSIFVCCCILSVVTAFIWISSNQNETNYISSFNVSQGGEVAVCGNRLYFLIEEAIYESDLVFSTSKRILDLNTYNVLLCAGDEKLYYIQKEWNYENKKYVNTIFEYPVGASKASACGTFETTKEVELFLFVDDQFFMKVSDSIMCYKLQDSSLSTVIGNDVTTYTYDDGFLYIANSSGDILRYNLNSKLQETVYTIAIDGGFVWSDDYNQLFIKDDSLYFRELVGGEEALGKPVSFNMKTKIYEDASESCSSHCVMDNTHYVIFQLDSTERSAFLNYYSGAIPNTAAIELYSMTSGRLYSAKSDSSEYKLCNTPNRYYSKIYYTGKGLLLKDGLEISDQWSFFSVR